MNFAAGLLLLAGAFQNWQENTKAIETQKSYELGLDKKQVDLYLELALLDSTVNKSEFDQIYGSIKTYDDHRSEVKKLFKSLGLSESADLVWPELRKAIKTYYSNPIKCRDDADGSVKDFFSHIASREVKVYGGLNDVGGALLVFSIFSFVGAFIAFLAIMDTVLVKKSKAWWLFGAFIAVGVTLVAILIFS